MATPTHMSPYTEDPSAIPSVVFPNQARQALSSCTHLLGVTILAFCFSRRVFLNNWTIPRLTVMLIFLDSWLFLFASGIVVFGIGMSLNTATCQAGIYLCIFFYATSKLLIYFFLSEKVHIVWSSGNAVSRLKCNAWICCMVVLLGFAAVFTLMVLGRIGFIRADGACVIGLEKLASLFLLTYDSFINVFLTALFIWPLVFSSDLKSPKLKRLAAKTLAVAIFALLTSVANILILTLLNGQQLGWVCLSSCGLDVTLNAVMIFIITQGNEKPVLAAELAAPPTLEKPRRTPRPPVVMTPRVPRSSDPDDSSGKVNTLARIGDFAETRPWNPVTQSLDEILAQGPEMDSEDSHFVGYGKRAAPDDDPVLERASIRASPKIEATRHPRGFLGSLRDRLNFVAKQEDEEKRAVTIQITTITEVDNPDQGEKRRSMIKEEQQRLPKIVESPAATDSPSAC